MGKLITLVLGVTLFFLVIASALENHQAKATIRRLQSYIYILSWCPHKTRPQVNIEKAHR